MQDLITYLYGEENAMKYIAEKITNFKRATITNSSIGDAEATSLPPVGESFLYIETSGKNYGQNVFLSFERTDIIQIGNITFNYNRFSNPTSNLRSLGRFRIQLLIPNSIKPDYSIFYNIYY